MVIAVIKPASRELLPGLWLYGVHSALRRSLFVELREYVWAFRSRFSENLHAGGFSKIVSKLRSLSRVSPWWHHKWKHFLCYWPLLGVSAGHRWIPPKKAGDAEFDVFFDLRLAKRLSKQSRHRWFETPSNSLWHQCGCNSPVLTFNFVSTPYTIFMLIV